MGACSSDQDFSRCPASSVSSAMSRKMLVSSGVEEGSGSAAIGLAVSAACASGGGSGASPSLAPMRRSSRGASRGCDGGHPPHTRGIIVEPTRRVAGVAGGSLVASTAPMRRSSGGHDELRLISSWAEPTARPLSPAIVAMRSRRSCLCLHVTRPPAGGLHQPSEHR